VLNLPLDLAELTFEELEPGRAAAFEYTVREADLEAFAALSGDRSPRHMDEAFARTSRYGTRIAQGMLVAAPVSALVGMCLPGKRAILLGQRLDFPAPVRIGDTLRLAGTVRSRSPATGIVVLDVEARRVGRGAADLREGEGGKVELGRNEGGEVVLRGEARVLVERAEKQREKERSTGG
jgi:3-hydroxybutyryl-CoA dehydratase